PVFLRDALPFSRSTRSICSFLKAVVNSRRPSAPLRNSPILLLLEEVQHNLSQVSTPIGGRRTIRSSAPPPCRGKRKVYDRPGVRLRSSTQAPGDDLGAGWDIFVRPRWEIFNRR